MSLRFIGRSIAFLIAFLFLILVMTDGLIEPTDVVAAIQLNTEMVIIMGFCITLAVICSPKGD